MIIVADAVEFLAADFKAELSKNDTCSEAHAVLQNVVAKCFAKDPESLETMVGRFPAAPNIVPLVAPPFIFQAARTTGTLRKAGVFSNVPVIGLHSLILFQTQLQVRTKDFNVWPVTRREWAIDPHDVAGADTDTNFIAQTTILELEGVECLGTFPLIRRLAISCVNLK